MWVSIDDWGATASGSELSGMMARFFFHVVGRLRWEDEDGHEFPSARAAYDFAVFRLGSVDRQAAAGAPLDLSIHVAGEDGMTLFAVSFGQQPAAFARCRRYWLN